MKILLSLLIFSFLPAFAQIDKAEHFVAGFAINGITTYGVLKITQRPGWSKLAGLTTGVAAGAVKEYLDTKGKGDPSMADFLFTAAGSFSFTIVLNLPYKKRESSGR